MTDVRKKRYLPAVKRPNRNSMPSFLQRHFRSQDGSINQLSRSGSSFASSEGSSTSQTSPDHTMNRKNGGASGGRDRGDTAKKKRSLSLKGILKGIGDHFRGQTGSASNSPPKAEGCADHSDEWLAVNCNLTCEELANIMTEFKGGQIGEDELWNRVYEKEREKRRVQGSMTLGSYVPNGAASRDQRYTGERKRVDKDRHNKGNSVPAFPGHDYDTPTEESPPPYYSDKIYKDTKRRNDEDRLPHSHVVEADVEDGRLVVSSSSSSSLLRSPSPSPSKISQGLESPPTRDEDGDGSSQPDLSLPIEKLVSEREKARISRENMLGDGVIVKNLSADDGSRVKRLNSDSRFIEEKRLNEPIMELSESTVVQNIDAQSHDESSDEENGDGDSTTTDATTPSGSVSVSGVGPIDFWNAHSSDALLPPAHALAQTQATLTRVPEESQMPPYLHQRGSDSPSSSLGRSTVSSTTSDDFSSSDGPSTRRQQSHSPDVQLKPTLFCSVARAKMDYIPSPYDTGALAFKKGELVYITRKPSGGYWEGVCQNKSGKFKFTFVEELSREEMPGLEGGHTFPLGHNQANASYVLHLQSVEELLRRIECDKYLSDFKSHDLASLERFKNLTEGDLDSLEITNLEHRVKLLTVAKLLLEPIKGVDVRTISTSALGDSPVPTQSPSPRIDDADLSTSIHKLRIAARDSGFYASTDAGLCGDNSHSPARKHCKNSMSSLEMLRESGLGSLCAEEEEEGPSTEVSGVLAPGSNCNNSNNISGILIPGVDGHYLRMCDQCSGLDSGSWGGEVPRDKPLKPVRTDVKAVDLLQRHSQFNNGATPVTVAAISHATPPQILENYYEFPWMDDRSLHMTRQQRCSPKHQVHSKLTQRASSPVLMNYPPRTEQNQLTVGDSGSIQWKRSASVDGTVTCSNGWSNTVNGVVPSPQLLRAVGQTDTCPALLLNSRRRKSRSVSPHKRQNNKKDTVSRDPMHGSPTLPLKKMHTGLGMHSQSLEKLLDAKLMADGIDIRQEPYSDKMGFCGFPAALVQRYAEEVQMRVPDVAVCLEALRVKSLIAEGRCWFRSDTLAHQAQHVIYAGRGSTVCDWLTYLGMPMYVDAFIGGGWDELDILMDMEEEDLRRCGVTDPKHTRRLRTALEHLKMTAKV
ncbi:uncharacterized protein LOC100893663 isoform X4 [Strongylocentrotus purpuratus]|uniref:Uncharacterized protein n=1 Tax=Strongylocentrotus purpuratus TaxID=7668 RepID=A0A7M7PHV7_STRPU|nr:uncharacterized protein LOC100893663 isoform X4 [Strongylocentrotus purpuratus]